MFSIGHNGGCYEIFILPSRIIQIFSGSWKTHSAKYKQLNTRATGVHLDAQSTMTQGHHREIKLLKYYSVKDV